MTVGTRCPRCKLGRLVEHCNSYGCAIGWLVCRGCHAWYNARAHIAYDHATFTPMPWPEGA